MQLEKYETSCLGCSFPFIAYGVSIFVWYYWGFWKAFILFLVGTLVGWFHLEYPNPKATVANKIKQISKKKETNS